jgi:hypothetical protein
VADEQEMQMKTPTKKQLIERFEQLILVLQGLSQHEKRKHFNMETWGEQTECGTTMCAAGFCGSDQWFRRRGFKFAKPLSEHEQGQIHFKDLTSWHALCAFFGYSYSEYYEGSLEADEVFRDPSSVRQVIAAAKRRIKQLKAMP